MVVADRPQFATSGEISVARRGRLSFELGQNDRLIHSQERASSQPPWRVVANHALSAGLNRKSRQLSCQPLSWTFLLDEALEKLERGLGRRR